MASKNPSLVLKETDDFDSIRELSLKSGLEDGTFENVAKAYGFYSGKQLVGCAALKVEGKIYLLDWLAVEADNRGKGLGSALVRTVEEEARKRGAQKIWALARAPHFFLKIGFRLSNTDDSDGPSLSNCQRCLQYRKICFPAIVVKNL